MQKADRAKEKLMAYVLHTEFKYTKVSIAQLMKISPQQMGVWIKDANYEVKIHNLQDDLNKTKQKLLNLGYSPQKSLDDDDFEY